MEYLAPPLELAIELQSALNNGESLRLGLARFATNTNSDFATQVRRFLIAWDQSQDWRSVLSEVKSAYRRALLELVAQGLAGQSVQAALNELQAEISEACEQEMKSQIEMLPFKMLLPLLLLQFPAFLILLFGPLLSRFIEELAR